MVRDHPFDVVREPCHDSVRRGLDDVNSPFDVVTTSGLYQVFDRGVAVGRPLTHLGAKVALAKLDNRFGRGRFTIEKVDA